MLLMSQEDWGRDSFIPAFPTGLFAHVAVVEALLVGRQRHTG